MSDSKNQKTKKIWFWLSIIINLGFLGVFKYFNFFAASFASAISTIGFRVDIWTLNVILPVGISFYTFHGLSYVIDIYNNKIKAENNFIDYSVFVSFFPLLVAGPIERATHLLPQIQKKRVFDYNLAVDGLKQIIWGLFKKVVVADQCATFVNLLFDIPTDYSGSTLFLGAVLFAFQIYGDFSGYSDIAIGTAKLFGINLLKNFSFPYFSRDIAEFWRRWHISLSSWFRDYLYIPLGGSKGGTWSKVRNTFIIFLVSGFWHGASWNFIIWGFLNALFIIPSILFNTNRNNLDIVAKGKLIPNFRELFSIIITFGLTTFAWIFFRANGAKQAINYLSGIFSYSLFTLPKLPEIPFMKEFEKTPPIFIILIVFIFIEWMGRQQNYALANLGSKFPKVFRWSIYYIIIFMVFLYSGKEQQFIYFQF